MNKIVGVIFEGGNRTCFFSPNNLILSKGNDVIVEGERGLQFAKVVTEIIDEKKENLVLPLKKIIRVVTTNDYIVNRKNIEEAKKALIDCEKLVKKHNLDMRLLQSYFTFDRKQLFFNFLADKRVDFRELAKDLAQIYKTRIELRQIGIRDKAKLVGGIGPCGRMLCCSKFLNDFDAVSINMAKNQNLALNPTKINGVCGRLLCCLNYEDDNYKTLRKGMPDVGRTVSTRAGNGKVVSVDILSQKYKVYVEDHGIIEVRLGDISDGSNK